MNLNLLLDQLNKLAGVEEQLEKISKLTPEFDAATGLINTARLLLYNGMDKIKLVEKGFKKIKLPKE